MLQRLRLQGRRQIYEVEMSTIGVP